MSEARSLQDLTTGKAGELFREQGYEATTLKQIARAAGCTTAALHYCFEDGKDHILREVIRESTTGTPLQRGARRGVEAIRGGARLRRKHAVVSSQ